jgi:hypothetical protein
VSFACHLLCDDHLLSVLKWGLQRKVQVIQLFMLARKPSPAASQCCCNLEPLFFSSYFKHQPLIAILTTDYYYFAKSLAQWNSSTTNPVVWTRRKKSERKNLLLAPPFLPLILPSSINYANLSSVQLLTPPSITRRNSCSHKQTNLPTHAFNPCIPCSNDGHLPAASMQKVDE